MGIYDPAFEEEYTNGFRAMLVQDRTHDRNVPVKPWNSDIAVGDVASWSHIEGVVIERTGEFTWVFRAIK